jgi:hypothetical protein
VIAARRPELVVKCGGGEVWGGQDRLYVLRSSSNRDGCGEDSHMASSRGVVIRREGVVTKQSGDDHPHEKFSIVVHRLEHDKFAVNSTEKRS